MKQERTRRDGVVYFTEFSDARLYEWFRSAGLTPRKSLTLGAIDVPDAHLASLARGLMDGDGSIQNFVHLPTRQKYPDYRYERLWVFFNSASRAHVDWLRARLRPIAAADGFVEVLRREGRHDFYRLKYGKTSAIELLMQFYLDPGSPRLLRKWRIWDEYAARNFCAEGGT